MTLVPWPALAQTARRIVRQQCRRWTWVTHEGARGPVPVRCYTSPDFAYTNLMVRTEDVSKILAGPGHLKIRSDDETLLLYYKPVAVMVLAETPIGTPYPGRWHDESRCAGSAQASDVLILGCIDSVELQVPNHAIDVIAALRPSPCVPPVSNPFGLN